MSEYKPSLPKPQAVVSEVRDLEAGYHTGQAQTNKDSSNNVSSAVASSRLYRHVDRLNRETFHPRGEYRLCEKSAKLRELVVQTVEGHEGNSDGWQQGPIIDGSPYLARLSRWRNLETKQERTIAYLKTILFLAGGQTVRLFRKSNEPKFRNGGNYDPFNYKYHGYPQNPTNAWEEPGRVERAPLLAYTESDGDFSEGSSEKAHLVSQPLPMIKDSRKYLKRSFTPRKLWMLKQPDSLERKGKSKELYDESVHPSGLQYMFVSFTADQFQTSDEKNTLRMYAEMATRQAKLKAFWTTDCLTAREGEPEDDTYCISDYARNAHTVLILLSLPGGGKLLSDRSERNHQIKTLLRQWGERVWTFPEALLAQRLLFWVVGEDSPKELLKTELPHTAWETDGPVSRRLVDHFMGSMSMTRLELVSAALEAFQVRSLKRGNQDYYRRGDRAYALMGLLDRRPEASSDDNDFEAFARLSLANDSDRLLERLICVSPLHPDQEWYQMDDAWGSKPWEILPTCQICGISDSNTVIIDGLHAASVRWKGFASIPYTSGFSVRRLLARFLPLIGSTFLLMGIVITATSNPSKGLKGQYAKLVKKAANGNLAAGLVFLFLGLIALAVAPYFIGHLYSGKMRNTQSLLMGFKGRLKLEQIEQNIWGDARGRLTWAPFGSSICADERVDYPNYGAQSRGTDPWEDEALRTKVMEHARRTRQNVFTLVDTGRRTVTMFLARRPPVAFLVTGQEGGMQRAVGVSYDFVTETLYREVVLRMETPVLSSMSRVGRVKFGFKRA